MPDRLLEGSTKSLVKDSEKIRVLMICTAGLGRNGSAAICFRERAKGFIRGGADVTILAPHHSVHQPLDVPGKKILIPMLVRHRLVAAAHQTAVELLDSRKNIRRIVAVLDELVCARDQARN